MCDHQPELRISAIVPTLHEEAVIGGLVAALLRECDEVIVADGASEDGTARLAAAAGARVVSAARGRGTQLRAGAAAATGDVLWFVHADSMPGPGSRAAILQAVRTAPAGVFSVRFAGGSRAARFMTRVYPWLSRCGLTYGDAALFVRREAYEAAGGFAPMALFEDLDLLRRLRRRGAVVTLGVAIEASSRRFEGRLLRTWVTWVGLQVLFWAGVPAERLARWYGR